MAPKKKGGKGGGKKKKGGCPDWMAPELYALTQDLPKLQEFWCGEIKESKGKGKDGQPLPQPPNITREQVGRAEGRLSHGMVSNWTCEVKNWCDAHCCLH
jgi:hypothetical protein